jgi:uncharacterized protein (DUF1810 family)
MSDFGAGLRRFAEAQAPVWNQVLRELHAGRKRSHWMWFVFPQLLGLGHSPTAQLFALASIEEAEAYLSEPTLGARLRECTRLVNEIQGRAIGEIFGYPDDLKFHSCMTLFARAAALGEAVSAENQVFREAIEKYFGGREDPRTLALLGRQE